jgi:hypothetical protein
MINLTIRYPNFASPKKHQASEGITIAQLITEFCSRFNVKITRNLNLYEDEPVHSGSNHSCKLLKPTDLVLRSFNNHQFLLTEGPSPESILPRSLIAHLITKNQFSHDLRVVFNGGRHQRALFAQEALFLLMNRKLNLHRFHLPKVILKLENRNRKGIPEGHESEIT